MSRRGLADPSRSLRVAAGLMVVALLVATTGLVVSLRVASGGSVQPVEIDLAGSQRRLSERIGLDVALLRLDPGDEQARVELRRVAARLDAIASGLVAGDEALGLDGRLPAGVAAAYGADGLDLLGRIQRLQAAATEIADTPGEPPPGLVDVVDGELDDERLVRDLDVQVAALSERAQAADDAARRAVTLALVATGAIVLVLGVAVVVAIRGTRAQQQAGLAQEREAAASLALEQRRFQLAMQHAPIGMCIVSLQGRFVEVNDALCELLARERDLLLACTFQEITHPEDLDTDLALLQQLIDGEADSYRLEKRYLTPQGEAVPALLAVAVVRPGNGLDDYFIAEIVDMREQARAQEAQQAALEQEREAVARLEELDRTKSNFVSTVSHELRTPLTSALGYLELLADEAVGPLNDAQQDMVSVVDRSSRRLLRLIEDLLSLSSIEARTMAPRTLVDVTELVTGALDVMAPIAHQQGVRLVAGCGEVPVVHGDRSGLERAVLNLVDNAVKFTPRGGEVRVGCEADAADPTVVVLTVADTGVGIAEEDQEHLFTRFFRSASAYDDAVPGTGLGLTITHDLVVAHGGTIEVESRLGVGTTVTVRLPIATLAEDVVPAAAGTGGGTAPGQALA